MKWALSPAALLACSIATASHAQPEERRATPQEKARIYAQMDLNTLEGVEGPVVGYAVDARAPENLDPKRYPWRTVPNIRNSGRARGFSTSVTLHYNGDGIQDVATMLQNSRQRAVVVTLGGSRKSIIAYRAPGQWEPDVGIMAAGRLSWEISRSARHG